ncbi:MAG TPA: alpha/beta fold hydrolase [Nevskiaceae bacterium]|nr:alpha/beta fold hydrolase [Nevskiaceae bacterium]
MTVESLDVTATDGHRFRALVFPAVDRSGAMSATTDGPPVLLFMPALGVKAKWYSRLGEAFAQAGVSFAIFDWRGIDTSSVRASRRVDFGYRHLLEDDLPAARAAVRARLPKGKLFVGGHSLGGQFSACHAGAQPDGVDGLVIIAGGNVHWRGWQGLNALGILAMTQGTVAISSVVGHFPGERLGFGGREARGVMRDWAAVARSGIYRARGSKIDYEKAMAALARPVLALGFRADGFAPARSTERLMAKLPRCDRTVWRWSESETGGAALDHFSWVKRPELVVPRVADWIKAR